MKKYTKALQFKCKPAKNRIYTRLNDERRCKMKKYCSTCKHGKPGQWVAATRNTERHRMIECNYELPSLPVWLNVSIYQNRFVCEMYRDRAETTCQCYEERQK